MQVTPEMVAAAQAATPRWMNATDGELRRLLQAAFEVAGDVELPVVATVRVQIDEPAFHASVAEAVQRMNDGLPRDRNGLITIATLLGTPTTDTSIYRRPTPMQIPDELLSTEGFEDLQAMAYQQHHIPVTEPRPAATIDDIAAVLGVHRLTVIDWITQPYHHFPAPVFPSNIAERSLYDLDAVKAWYDALPQAADG
jgi:hypothetical protein